MSDSKRNGKIGLRFKAPLLLNSSLLSMCVRRDALSSMRRKGFEILGMLLLSGAVSGCGGGSPADCVSGDCGSGTGSRGNGAGTSTGSVAGMDGGTSASGGGAPGGGVSGNGARAGQGTGATFAGTGAMTSAGGIVGGGGAGGGSGVGDGAGGSLPESCQMGTTETAWATECAATPQSCTAGSWTAPSEGSDGHPLRAESEHFAIYWYETSDAPPSPLQGVASVPSSTTVQNALQTLEDLWDAYFGAPILFPEPYCQSGTKWKAAVHIDDDYPLWGGGWGGDKMGLWVGPEALEDTWGLAHEFMHGVQATTQGFPDCGGTGCWIYESHANWMPHQVERDDVHCSEMLVNAPHLYYGSTRDRYCNWQFFEFLKDKHCYSAVHEMWTYEAPAGQGDPWQKLMLSQGWDIDQLNDLFGEWAMHNVTWDYQNPDGSDQGEIYRQNYGRLDEDPGARTARRLRLTRLEALGEDWGATHRFVSPYYWAPQRWGYNVIELHPEQSASEVTLRFRGVLQEGAHTGFRYGLVATDEQLTNARYSSLGSGTEGSLRFCIDPGEKLFVVVVATPTEYQKIVWEQPSDGPPYPSIYRYPYMIEVHGAWPNGFSGGTVDDCPDGTVRHENGGGCAPPGTPESVYVGTHARILGGNVSGEARIEDQATVVSGAVSGGIVGGLSLIGVESHPGHGPASFSVSDAAQVRATFYPLGWFGNNQSVSGTAQLLGDLEYVSSSKSSGGYYGLVSDDWAGVEDLTEVTLAPPYEWRP